MSIRTLKTLINSFTDFEFLASINIVDFQNKKIDVKRNFFNRLIGAIKQNVEIKTRSQLQILVNNIKDLYLQRLGKVNTTSFFKYFFKNIKIVFQSFSRRIAKFFEKQASATSSARPITSKKPEVRKEKDIEIRQPVLNKQEKSELRPTAPTFIPTTIQEESESESDDREIVSSNDVSTGSSVHGSEDGSEIEFNNDELLAYLEENASDPSASDIESEILNEVNSEFSTDHTDDENCLVGYGESDQLI